MSHSAKTKSKLILRHMVRTPSLVLWDLTQVFPDSKPRRFREWALPPLSNLVEHYPIAVDDQYLHNDAVNFLTQAQNLF